MLDIGSKSTTKSKEENRKPTCRQVHSAPHVRGSQIQDLGRESKTGLSIPFVALFWMYGEVDEI